MGQCILAVINISVLCFSLEQKSSQRWCFFPFFHFLEIVVKLLLSFCLSRCVCVTLTVVMLMYLSLRALQVVTGAERVASTLHVSVLYHKMVIYFKILIKISRCKHVGQGLLALV